MAEAPAPLSIDDLAKALRDAYWRGYAHGYGGASAAKAEYEPRRDAWIRQYIARMPVAVPAGPEAEAGEGWRPMKDAPTGVPIIARHKPNDRMPGGWVATIKLGHRDVEEEDCYDTILHYNGDASFRGFRGMWTGWLPIGSALSTDREGQQSGGETHTPQQSPSSSNPEMTVEEARNILRELPAYRTPDEWVSWYQDRAEKNKNLVIGGFYALRVRWVQTALRTLQASSSPSTTEADQ